MLVRIFHQFAELWLRDFMRAILAPTLRARGVHARCPAGMCSRFVLATEVVDTPTTEGAWNSGHPGPRPSGTVHLRSCSDVANLGQNIQPEAAKRTVVQTATLDTGRILHDHQQVTCERERTGEISGLEIFERRTRASSTIDSTKSAQLGRSSMSPATCPLGKTPSSGFPCTMDC